VIGTKSEMLSAQLQEAMAAETECDSELGIAHVLFIDTVGYSKLVAKPAAARARNLEENRPLYSQFPRRQICEPSPP
jgi:hypothetical protein